LLVLESDHDTFPIVENATNMMLVGSAMRTHLQIAIGEYEYTTKKEEGASRLVVYYAGETNSEDDANAFVVPMDPAPFQIHVMTPLTKAHFLFSMLGLSHAWIVSEGRLVGVLTKKDLINARL
jgi:hypothetical protein